MTARRSPRKKPAQERSRETVRALVTAAARILEQDGYEGASVNRIARVAGVSVGSLYQYFPTKEALVAAVAEKLSSEMIAVFQEDLPDLAQLTFEEAIVAVAERTVRTFRYNPRLRQVIVDELPESLMGRSDFDVWLATAIEAYFDFHREEVRPRDHKLAVAIVVAAVEAAAKVAALRGDPDEVVAEELAHLVRGYVRRG